jgi:uncharacterized protein YkwD
MSLTKKIVLGTAAPILVILAVLGFVFQSTLAGWIADVQNRLVPASVTNVVGNTVNNVAKNVADNVGNAAGDVKQEIFSPPLQVFGHAPVGTLDREGVIILTNQNRAQNGDVAALKENTTLDQAAMNKLEDMFKNQYFEHVSPSGNGPGYVVTSAGYNYLTVGENLAMGDFTSDQDLMNAWMASPGHRANILNPDFIDIGVAVATGTYQGNVVWMAVQEFGRPASSCPIIDAALKAKITVDQNSLTALDDELSADQAALSTMPRSTPEEQSSYNEKVRQYNAEVDTYDTNQANLKQEVATYNDQVEAYNACLAK